MNTNLMQWKQLLNPKRPDGTSQVASDHREQFERDYDRTVFSTPVRRLQDKTQVFPLDPNDSVRTRLTHSLEVSTLARGLARAVTTRLMKDGKIEGNMDRQIEAIAATCGLLHDLGNPPFGHAGEDAIRAWFESHFAKDPALKALSSDSQYTQDFLLFQGNAQTVRLITKLQILATVGGLNLTFGTLSAALKYVAASHQVEKGKRHSFSKLGFFASENDIISRTREATGTNEMRNPITFLVEAADDLAYSVVDLEDGISKGILGWKKLKSELEDRMGKDDPVLKEVLKGTYRVLRMNVENDEKLPDKSYTRAFRTAVIGEAVKAVAERFVSEHDRILEGAYDYEIVYDSPVEKLIATCKTVAAEFVYRTQGNLKLELMGRNIIRDLLDFFWEGAKNYSGETRTRTFPEKIVALLSDNYKEVFKAGREAQKHLPIEYLRLQLVTDYVCGMTDSFAVNLHRELRNG